MLANPKIRWDIFCRVIDNFGDIGVCWRLARQLVVEHGLNVRLWVDDLSALACLCPEINPEEPVQTVSGIEVRLWEVDAAYASLGDVVIEAFACRLPESFEMAMAARTPSPVWINLDYLSAEDWVSGCHALPSPHPQLPLTKYFFFPGFDETTGGLLRERDLESQRLAFTGTAPDFWRALGFPPPPTGALTVSLFAYENTALPELLNVWVQNKSPVCCAAPVGKTLPVLETFAGRRLQAGDIVQFGQFELRILPFLPQPDYDRLLWACDINFVRGEDSFVRAHWAEKPMIWHIYPQNEAAHRVKLTAFLDRYCAEMPETTACAVREFFLVWNAENCASSSSVQECWTHFTDVLPELRRHVIKWGIILKKQEDLCSNLVRFCRSKV